MHTAFGIQGWVLCGKDEETLITEALIMDGTKKDLRSIKYEDLVALTASLGEKKFRADQVYDWLHTKCVDSYDGMKNVPGSLKNKLAREYEIYTVHVVEVLKSKFDGTRKYLFSLHDGNIIESVFMKYEHGNSVCVSSQVGCSMGCRFCASTIDGRVRNLTAGEILGQIYGIMLETGERISNVVVMGSGEPLDNYDNLIDFIRILTSEKGLNISQRNITVSTCGLVDKIYELAKLKLQITLAISLHAATDEKRQELMPIARKYSLSELIEACRHYFDETGRRLTFEYALVKGENDSDSDADTLAKLIRALNCHVNLIPVNPIKERDFRQSDKSAVQAFRNRLEQNHVTATVRRTLGADINGACGQLRKAHLEKIFD